MLLTLDVGNSRLKLGLFTRSSKVPVRKWVLRSLPGLTSDELRIQIRNCLEEHGIVSSDLENVIVSTVVPELNHAISRAFSPLTVRYVDHHWPFCFSIKTERPETIGIDRLVAAEAAVQGYKSESATIVIDSGTATTVSVVSNGLEFLGGVIFPGMKNSAKALVQNTSQLHHVELLAPKNVIGKNSDEAIRSGIVWGHVFQVKAFIEAFESEIGSPCQTVLTGGGAFFWPDKDSIPWIHYVDLNLSLNGLNYLYETIRSK